MFCHGFGGPGEPQIPQAFILTNWGNHLTSPNLKKTTRSAIVGLIISSMNDSVIGMGWVGGRGSFNGIEMFQDFHFMFLERYRSHIQDFSRVYKTDLKVSPARVLSKQFDFGDSEISQNSIFQH